MKVNYEADIEVDIDKLFHNLTPSDRRQLLLEHIHELENDDILNEAHSRGLVGNWISLDAIKRGCDFPCQE